jgi:hypothetical protein
MLASKLLLAEKVDVKNTTMGAKATFKHRD